MHRPSSFVRSKPCIPPASAEAGTAERIKRLCERWNGLPASKERPKVAQRDVRIIALIKKTLFGKTLPQNCYFPNINETTASTTEGWQSLFFDQSFRAWDETKVLRVKEGIFVMR